jgi:D-alanyl-D-alanine carboxypeptidase (penicillin-binding protein 5/6)
MDYGIDNYNLKQISPEKKPEPLLVKDGQKREERLNMNGDLTLLLRDDEKVSIEYDLPKALQAPVKANSMVGYAKYYINDTLYKEIPIYATEEIEKIDFPFCLKKIIGLWGLY